MNIYLKTLVLICVATTLSEYAWSSEEDFPPYNPRSEECLEARYGKLNLNLVTKDDDSYNAHMFSCAIAPVIAGVKEKESEGRKRIKNKVKIADFFASKGMDINYRGSQYEDTLLMSVVTSYMPNEWKLKYVKMLLDEGADIHIKDSYGNTAIDFAVFEKNPEIIELLSKHTD